MGLLLSFKVSDFFSDAGLTSTSFKSHEKIEFSIEKVLVS